MNFMARHILIIPSWYSHARSLGAGSFFRDQALALAAAGHKVGLITAKVWGLRDYRSGSLPEMNVVTVEDDGPIRVYHRNTLHRVPRAPFRDSFAFCRSGSHLYDAYVAAEGCPDLIHAHGALYGGLLARNLSARTGIPFVLTEHSSDFAEAKHRWWQRILVRRVLKHAGARVAVSEALAALMTSQYPEVARPISVIPNILTPAFEEVPDDIVSRPNDEQCPFVFLCVARISREKNQAGLVRAFAEAFPDEPGIELHFIGPGDETPIIEAARQAGVEGQVRIFGALPSEPVRQAMTRAGAVVLPSFVETFGVVVIESLAVGTPVVATASGGPEGIIAPETGIVVPVGDHDALVYALLDIRRRRGEFDAGALRRSCLERYGREVVAARLESIYDQIAWGNKP
ncbi:MAG: glycosyltransferase [Rhodospirillaceae bacterium]